MAKKKKIKKRNKKSKGFKAKLLLSFGILMAVVLLPSTMLLSVGMLPTFVAVFADKTKKKSKAVTIGALNLAGCMPFLLQLWSQGHSFETSSAIVSDPMAIIVMYSAAAVGYLIFWAMFGLVSSVLFQRGVSRQEAIKKRQADLIGRWGPEVAGDIKLDENGFPLEKPDVKNPTA